MIGFFDDARLGLEAYASAIQTHYDIKLPKQPGVYCTWYHAAAYTEEGVAANTEFAAREIKPYGLEVMQIDDGWQAGEMSTGPKKNFTAHDPEGPYPSGMKKMADRILAAEMVPGIWWMAFSGSENGPHYLDKQHLFVKEQNGEPRNVAWGGTCLDMTNPDALAYVRENARRIAKDWGYGYFKLDGLWSGLAAMSMCAIYSVNDCFYEDDYGEQVRFDPSIPPVQAYRMGMKAIREGAGDDVFILGCTIIQHMRTMGASYGVCDAMRVGPDNRARNWSDIIRGVRHSANRFFFNGRVWYNDPDPHYVRPLMTLHQARTLSSWVAITGWLNCSSEVYDELPPERLDILRRTLPAHGLPSRPVDYLESPVPQIWMVTDDRTAPIRHVLGFFNWSEDDQKDKGVVSIDRSLAQCDLADDRIYVGYDFWKDEFLPPVKDRIEISLPLHECRVWALREKSDYPIVISTSRHITQGLIDLVDEKWDADGRILSGTSHVMADEPYELRIVNNGEQLSSVKLTEERPGAQIARVNRVDKNDTAGVRVRITSDKTRAVEWIVVFSEGAV